MSFFSEQDVKNQQADQPWLKSETDRMLDLYFNGMPPDRIAVELKRNPKAVHRRLEQFSYNERDWVTRYEPRKRISRKGKKLTQNESVMLAAHNERKVPIAATAKLMARPVQDLTKGEVEVEKNKSVQLPSTFDLILAHRHLYFLRKKPVISDEAYDALVQEEIEYGGGGKRFEEMKDWKKVPLYIRDLALYLEGKYE